MVSPLDHVLLFASLLVFHVVILWFSYLRAFFFAESVGRARPPVLPWFVWVTVAVGFLAVYAALVFSARSVNWDTSWFFLVAMALNLVVTIDFAVLSRRLAARSEAGRE